MRSSSRSMSPRGRRGGARTGSAGRSAGWRCARRSGSTVRPCCARRWWWRPRTASWRCAWAARGRSRRSRSPASCLAARRRRSSAPWPRAPWPRSRASPRACGRGARWSGSRRARPSRWWPRFTRSSAAPCARCSARIHSHASGKGVIVFLSPQEIDKLTLHQAGFLAQKRLARGVRLNHPEAVALIATQLLEFIRDGRRVAELMDLGRKLLGRNQVMPGVPEMIHDVQVEGTFPDGSKLVTVHHPIAAEEGDLALALYGSFLP